MKRTARLSLLAAAALLGLPGCGGKSSTALVVVNHTSAPIRVAFTQAASNTTSSVVTNDQEVKPGYSTRFFGTEGDTLSVHIGDAPPFTIEYSQRSQVVQATDDGIIFRKGFNEPEPPAN